MGNRNKKTNNIYANLYIMWRILLSHISFRTLLVNRMMSKEAPTSIYPKNVDLNNCDREPIHLIGKIQSHGFLIAGPLATKTISHCSHNCDRLFHQKPDQLFGLPISELLPESVIEQLFAELKGNTVNFLPFEINQIKVDIIAHLSDEDFILEFEIVETRTDVIAQQLMLTRLVSTISNMKNGEELNDYLANVMKTHFGYDRVMILQFDHEWNGSIVAEAREEELPSWLGLHYPNTDIPVSTRRLLRMEITRMVANVGDTPVSILADPKIAYKDLDLSRSELRGVSPVQIEYLTNMKVGATMNVPILTGESVWGVVLCHHYSPKSISYNERLSYKFLAKFFATQLQINRSDEMLRKIKSSSLIRAELINQIIDGWNIPEGLSQHQYTLNDLTDSTGAAIYIGDKITLVGTCPTAAQVLALIKQIRTKAEESWYWSNNISKDFPEAQAFKASASGVLCTFISKSNKEALLWFKPELKETVYWAGKPQDKSGLGKEVKISPRKSFEKWKQIQDGVAAPWKENEIAVVKEFRKDVINFVAQKYDEVKLLNRKLKKAYQELESFSYSVSHDLRAPLRGIDGFAQIIKEDYYEALDDFGKSSIETIINSVHKMNTLIDDILAYSGLDQKRIRYRQLSIQQLWEEEITTFTNQYPNTEVQIEKPLPEVYADATLLVLLLRNLLDNAFKYSAKAPRPKILIGAEAEDVFYIRDNGIGFDPKHNEQIFKVFHRLDHDNFKGSGIGLSIAKRVIDKHNGKIWGKSEVGKGATFYFQLRPLLAQN